ncbi:unnamed protein product [Meganyctiphanes norvegica]|uniref:Uncharacterized protein n=1 Tax=Meganyctiphanes norvegica TaxID=48144 RepID=A0AAV2PQX0_MEGNR
MMQDFDYPEGNFVQYHAGTHEHRMVQAAYDGHADIVRVLINKVSDVNCEATPRHQFSPASALWFAAYVGNIQVMEVLLQHPDIDINKGQQYNHITPLMTACCVGRDEAIRLLLKKGAKVLLKDERHRTALTWALISAKYQLYEKNGIGEAGNLRRHVVVNLLRRYPPEQIEVAVQEVNKRRPSLLTRKDILTVVPSLQACCRDVVLQYVTEETFENILPLPPLIIRDLKWDARTWGWGRKSKPHSMYSNS